MTRTHQKHYRVYVNGVDLSGYERQIGQMGVAYETSPDAALTDAVKNVILGQADVTLASLNGFLDNDTAGKFNLLKAGNNTIDVMIPIGANTAPAAGDHVFAWEFEQTSFISEPGQGGFAAATVTPGGSAITAPKTYSKPWGTLLHAYAARTAVNSSTGIDGTAQTTAGGIFVYQLFSSDGTVTLKAQDASSNLDGSFSDLSGATSGSITAAVTPAYGMVALSTTATVKRYLRWQLAFGTATTATFALAFIRG